MDSCFQFRTQSVLEHGKSVWSYADRLLSFLEKEEKEEELSTSSFLMNDWKLPTWLLLYRKQLLENVYSKDVLQTYLIYHDCGKPFCRQVDEAGRQHFPNHAEVSYNAWSFLLSRNPELNTPNNKIVAELIRHDMDVHLLKSDRVPAFCELGKQMAASLLIAGLAELHSNAQMFGGLNSDSFRIKWKNLEKRGKQVCSLLFHSPVPKEQNGKDSNLERKGSHNNGGSSPQTQTD